MQYKHTCTINFMALWKPRCYNIGVHKHAHARFPDVAISSYVVSFFRGGSMSIPWKYRAHRRCAVNSVYRLKVKVSHISKRVMLWQKSWPFFSVYKDNFHRRANLVSGLHLASSVEICLSIAMVSILGLTIEFPQIMLSFFPMFGFFFL